MSAPQRLCDQILTPPVEVLAEVTGGVTRPREWSPMMEVTVLVRKHRALPPPPREDTGGHSQETRPGARQRPPPDTRSAGASLGNPRPLEPRHRFLPLAGPRLQLARDRGPVR